MSQSPSFARKPVLLAAGGTGGHLFPAYALAEELGRRGFAVDLVTDMRGDRFGSGFPARRIHQVPSSPLKGRSPAAIAGTALTLSKGVWAALRLLGEIKPSVVVGFGGYPSFPPLLAARIRQVPSALHEQNAILGRANRMLAKRVNAIALSFDKTEFLPDTAVKKAVVTGNPVRDAVMAVADRPYISAWRDQPFGLLVFGGSQGANYFSDLVPLALAGLSHKLRERLEVVQQARAEDVPRVEAAYKDIGINALVAPFFPDLPEYMARAHLVIGRAGASTIAELSVLGRPSILVPFPHAIENDQMRNATFLAEAGGAWCLEQKGLTPERLTQDIDALMRAPHRLEAAAKAAKAQGYPDAVARLADLVADLAANPRKPT